MALATQDTTATVGDVDMVLEDGTSTGRCVRFQNVLYVLGIRFNLISGSKLADKGIAAERNAKGLILCRKNGTILALGSRKGSNWLLAVRRVIQNTTVLQ